MDDKELFGKKYPKSKHGKECLGPCYEPNTSVLHPLTLDYVTHKNMPFCPTEKWEYEDPKTGVKTDVLIDFCMVPTSKEDIGKSDIEMNILIPKFDFSCEYFLKMYYKLYSFDKSINYINSKKSSPLLTRMRILECALKTWGNTDQFVITDDLVALFTLIIKKWWIRDIYSELSKYINITDGKISIGRTVGNNNTVEKTNYLLKKITDPSLLYKIISRYHTKYSAKWDTIELHLVNMKKFLMEYLEQKLLQTIEK